MAQNDEKSKNASKIALISVFYTFGPPYWRWSSSYERRGWRAGVGNFRLVSSMEDASTVMYEESLLFYLFYNRIMSQLQHREQGLCVFKLGQDSNNLTVVKINRRTTRTAEALSV